MFALICWKTVRQLILPHQDPCPLICVSVACVWSVTRTECLTFNP